MEKRPNILMIMADQHRYDCIGYSNKYPVKTPNIDKLAQEGIWFDNAFTPIPVCCPSRQSMYAGRRAETFGCLWNFSNGLKTGALEPSDYNWVRDLRDHGYQTCHLGKWSIHPEFAPEDYGFNESVSDKSYDEFKKQKYPDVKYTNGYFGENDPIPLEDSRTHYLSGKASEMMEKLSYESDNPWLLCIDFSEPHLPCRPAGKFADMYSPESIPIWENFQEEFINKPYIQKQQLLSWGIEDYTWEDWAPVVARYYGTISQVDDACGIILKKLDDLGLSDNTVVIYTADHGDMCGGHRMMDKHYVLYDDIVRVPLIIRYSHIQREEGIRSSEFICHSLDIPPTIMDIAGLPQQKFFQGYSLLPLIKNEKVDSWRNDVVSTYNGQQFGLYTQRMLRTDKWKYIWNTTDVDELYNLEEDPTELTNLIYEETRREALDILRKRLYQILIDEKDELVLNNDWLKRQLFLGRKI